jgi:hypothetical protein
LYEGIADRAALGVERTRAKAAAPKRWIAQANQSVELAGQRVAQLEAKKQRLKLAADEAQNGAPMKRSGGPTKPSAGSGERPPEP